MPSNQTWRMPAEWEPHEATWIAWPHNRSDWPGKFTPIPWVYGEIVRHLHEGEKVHILVNDKTHEKRARLVLDRVGVVMKQIRFFPFPTDRVWTRDYGPLFVQSDTGQLACTCWRFNAWAKYTNWKRDAAINVKIAKKLNLPYFQPTWNNRPVVLEGGSIDVNGAGLLLTTEECLLSPIQARNPDLSRAELEKVLSQNLGVQKILWLDKGIAGDDTHGHIDDLTRFVAPTTVVTVLEKNLADPNFTPLQENLQRLQAMSTQLRHPLEIIPLPMPQPLFFQEQRLPASYANFYIANSCVLVPTFNDPADRHALGVLADLFPTRKVIGIHAVDLVWGLGTLHCLTQQQPR